MKRINKKRLAYLIFKKINKVAPKKYIYDAITIINEIIIESLVKGESFSVHNFGTLSPYTQKAHVGKNIATGAIAVVNSFKYIKFRAHANMLRMIEQRKEQLNI